MALGEALTHISALSGEGAHWMVAEGVINVVLERGKPQLLDVNIEHLALTDASNLLLSVDQLMQSAEVQKYLANTNLTYRLPRSIWTSEVKEKPLPKPLELRNVTMSAVLNMLVAGNGKAVWVYNESNCPNSRNSLDLRIIGE